MWGLVSLLLLVSPVLSCDLTRLVSSLLFEQSADSRLLLVNRQLPQCRNERVRVELFRGLAPVHDVQDVRAVVEGPQCRHVDADRFVLHASKVFNASDPELSFGHVVNENYLLRFCVCSNDEIGLCDSCRFGLNVVCQRLRLREGPGVFEWCHDPKEEETEQHMLASVLQPVFDSCDTLSLTAILASCTPIQSYDVVQVGLYGADDDNDSCTWSDHSISSLHSSKSINVEAINDTHGRVSVTFTELGLGSKYCLRLEWVNHPYCLTDFVVATDERHVVRSRPAQCIVTMEQPVVIPKCLEGRVAAEMQVKASQIVPITIIALAVAFIATLILGILYWLKRKGGSSKSYFKNDNGLTSLEMNGVVMRREQNEVHSNGTNKYSDSYSQLLILPSSSTGSLSQTNSLLASWLRLLTDKRVVDLHDASCLDETVMSNQESWVLELVDDVNTQIVLIETSSGSLEEEQACLLAPQDGIDELVSFALGAVKTHLFGQYNRVVIVRYEEQPGVLTQSITPHTNYVLPEHFLELRHRLRGEVFLEEQTQSLQELEQRLGDAVLIVRQERSRTKHPQMA